MSKKEKDFDYISEIENLEVPDMLKVGFQSYIERNDLKIQDKKEFGYPSVSFSTTIRLPYP